MKTFGEKQAMQKLHLNQIQVSGLTGKSKGSISQYLSDKQVPPEETQVDIALALGLAEDYFSDKNDKFSVGAQVSNSSYSKSGYSGYSKAHLLTKYKVNDHLTLKNKIIRNFDIDEIQGEIGVVYNPLKDADRLQLEVTAANYQSQNVITRQRLKFSTSFKF